MRRTHRENIAKEIRQDFHPEVALTVHWDSKILPELMSKESVDRLAVLVSGEGIMKLLRVPKLTRGTGEEQANAVFQLLDEWNIVNRVHFMYFDTTASNIGLKKGVCTILEQKIGRNLLSLACRHHIFEIIISKVFNYFPIEHQSGPDLLLFKTFSKFWKNINKEGYESVMLDDSYSFDLKLVKNDIINFIRNQLSIYQPRDDYKELLHLSLIFLGENIGENVKIQAPEAFHRARWMSKIIYFLEMYMFRSKFELKPEVLEGLKTFNVFIVKVYIKYWFTSPNAASASTNDLHFIKHVKAYEKKTIAKMALECFSRHLWFLSPTLVGLSFFDNNVSNENKLSMVSALSNLGSDENPAKKLKIQAEELAEKKLSDLVTNQTIHLFEVLNIETSKHVGY